MLVSGRVNCVKINKIDCSFIMSMWILILSTSPVFIDCSLYQHSMIGDIKGLHILFVLFMECQMWTLMVTVILMSYFFVVAPFVELQFTANGLQCLSIHSFSEYLGWRSKENFKISCLSCSCSYYSAPYFVNSFGTTYFPTAGISLGTWRWRYFNLCQEHPIWINGWLSIGWSAKSFTWEMVGNHWKSPNIH